MVWIEINFDERWFPEPVWNGLYTTARSLRYVTTTTVERVRVASRRYLVDDKDLINVIEFAITLAMDRTSATKIFQFGPRGYWRVCPPEGCGDVPFMIFSPHVSHDYERDLINRTELRVALLQR
ncbi:MAG TPA: hypothetical protein VGW38_16195, partial [Chloroflexota bacterium]|nr:hypothetical protein [Chloroflexota bacterium]